MSEAERFVFRRPQQTTPGVTLVMQEKKLIDARAWVGEASIDNVEEALMFLHEYAPDEVTKFLSCVPGWFLVELPRMCWPKAVQEQLDALLKQPAYAAWLGPFL